MMKPLSLALSFAFFSSVSMAAPLHDAAEKGDLAALRAELAKGVSVNAQNGNGETALAVAAKADQAAVVRHLLERGARPSDPGSEGALYGAARFDRREIAEILLKAGASVDGCVNGESPLGGAARHGHAGMVQWLLENKASPVACDQNPLVSALIKNERKISRALLKAGASVHKASLQGFTPLIAAAGNGLSDFVREFLAAKVEVDARTEEGFTALMAAARAGDGASVKLLLAAGANADLKDKQGRNAAAHALEKGHRALVELLPRGN